LGCNSVGNAEASDSNRRRTSKSPRVLPEETRVSSDAILDLNLHVLQNSRSSGEELKNDVEPPLSLVIIPSPVLVPFP
jgi:hypothetical protein